MLWVLIAAMVITATVLLRRPLPRESGIFARWLRAQVLVLCFGGVFGPLLLYGYFEGRPRHDSTMLVLGLLGSAVVVLIPLLSAKASARTAAMEQSGVWALAQITSPTDTNRMYNERPVVKVTLHIAGPGFAFDTPTQLYVSPARQGNLNARTLVVLVDPTTRHHRIDWEKSSLVNGLVPAQFTVSEDGRTYDLTGRAGPLMEIVQIANSALDQKVDLPSDPALRQRVLAVIRRAAPHQPEAVPAPAQAPASTAERLRELETLRAGGAISDAEYTRKREQIIADL
jgi:hypothetical protein